ncbi:DUF2637 domain-containing protein [Arthrobacter pigmenti]
MSGTTVARTNRINPDSIQALWVTVALVGFLAVASFMVSFSGLHEVAAWAGLPDWLRWAVPVFIDVAILAYTLAVLIHRHRGEPTWASWVSLSGFTLVSMIANFAHAWAMPHPNLSQRIIGAGVAALAPVAVFAATEQLGRLIIRHPVTEHVALMDRHPVTVEVPGAVSDAQVATEAVAGTVQEEPVAATEPAPESTAVSSTAVAVAERPRLSVVGHRGGKPSLADWVRAEISADRTPTGTGAAAFLGVSDRTGRRNLMDLKAERPELFEAVTVSRREGTPR